VMVGMRPRIVSDVHVQAGHPVTVDLDLEEEPYDEAPQQRIDGEDGRPHPAAPKGAP
jgi:hypothetical protein